MNSHIILSSALHDIIKYKSIYEILTNCEIKALCYSMSIIFRYKRDIIIKIGMDKINPKNGEIIIFKKLDHEIKALSTITENLEDNHRLHILRIIDKGSLENLEVFEGKILCEMKERLKSMKDHSQIISFFDSLDNYKESYGNILYVIYEYCVMSYERYLMENEINLEEVEQLILQIGFQIENLGDKLGFRHGDLHTSNVLMRKDSNFDENENKYYRYVYHIDDGYWEIFIPVRPLLVTIIDFDRCDFNGKNFMEDMKIFFEHHNKLSNKYNYNPEYCLLDLITNIGDLSVFKKRKNIVSSMELYGKK
jgi:hypothetical protein